MLDTMTTRSFASMLRLWILLLSFVRLSCCMAQSDAHQVVWNELGSDENSSMPLGNGDIALNAWTEANGDVVFLIAKSDAWSENAQLLKVGRIRLRLTPNPFVNRADFSQTLYTNEARMEVRAGSNSVELWVDANNPVIHVSARTEQPSLMSVCNEGWRNADYHMTQEQLNRSVFNYWEWRSNPNGIDFLADKELDAGKRQTAWCHFNSHSMFSTVLEREHLGNLVDKYEDPLLNLCFGAVVEGPNLVRKDARTLVSRKATGEQTVHIAVLTEKADSPRAWLNSARKILTKAAKTSEAKAWEGHRQWWNDFWQRSWIRISGSKEAEQASQGYLMNRYMTAICGRGKYPIKFNGSLLTVGRDIIGADDDPAERMAAQTTEVHDPDFRDWGSCFWHQNIRHTYYPLVASGDYDLLMPWLNMYTNALPLAIDRTKTYYGHGGASFIETIHFFGLPNLMDFGWDNPGNDPQSHYMRWHTQGALEIVVQMLDYFDNSQDSLYLREKILPFAEAVLTYYNEHWQRGADGKIRFWPHQSIEMYQEGVVNPTPDIAGLLSITSRMLAMPQVPEETRNLLTNLRSDLPEIPMGTTENGKIPRNGRGDANGLPVILPAQVYVKSDNAENPELYTVFPYRNYGLGKPDIELARNTFRARLHHFNNCWGQDGMEAALLGFTDEARAAVVSAMTCYGTQKFPWFWRKVADYSPDMDNGGTGAMTLQLMLMQTEGRTIRLLPAWPADWNAEFKLHAPYRTTVEGRVEKGQLIELRVTPESRAKDVIVMQGLETEQRGNPFIRHLYTADPSAHVWSDGRLYVYPSHDVDPPRGCDLMDRYHVFSTNDMVHWRDHGEILNSGQVEWGRPEGGFMWAPDCAYKNGKYYFYFPHPSGSDWNSTWKVGIAISDKPDRDFKVWGYLKDLGNEFAMIDPCVFVDTDGQAYFYYGGGGRCVGARLKDNMVELAEPLREMQGFPDFHEATWVHRRGDFYYLSYADGYVENGRGANRLHYAMSRSPLGPWEHKGILLEPTGCDTSHGSIVEYKGQWYLFYHNQSLSNNGNLRSICVDSLFYNEDGTIRTVRQTSEIGRKTYNSYKGLVMAGYQGWFNAPDDGAGRGWYHYQGRQGFKPGSTNVDLWPDVSEYPKLYDSPFKFDDGTIAQLPSPYDYSTVDTHFRWMKEYGLDGVFMQRFVGEVSNASGKRHFNQVLDNAMRAANKYERAICVMYDLSGQGKGVEERLLRDIDEVSRTHHLKEHSSNPSYLYHNGCPLVVVWGVGFNDNRAYGLDEAQAIVSGLKERGFSVMLGVPTYWRELRNDTEADARLHDIIRQCDIIMPWFVGRYDEQSYAGFQQLIVDDMAWCRQNHVDYAPLCFPGFSWRNMHYPRQATHLPRNGGSFFKKQLDYCLEHGAQMLYIAMFDEIDEGTAIFKLARRVPTPTPGSTFVPLDEGIGSDHYLRLAGEAARRLKQRDSR